MSETNNSWLNKLLGRFRSDRKGSVAIMFAGAALVMMMLIAGGIETYRRSLAQAMLQKAVDASALAAKRREADLKPTSTQAAARAAGEADARALFNKTIGDNTKIFPPGSATAAFQWQGDGSIKVTGTGTINLFFGDFLPADYKNISATGVVGFGEPLPTEVALVLDNTASMFKIDPGRSTTRFTEMRNAAKRFTHTLFDAAQQSGDAEWLRMSVVPWVTSVNVLSEAPRAANFGGKVPVVNMADKGSQSFVTTPLSRTGRVNLNAAQFDPVGWRGCISGSTETPTPTDTGGMNWNALHVASPPLSLTQHSEGDIQNVTYNVCVCSWQDNGQPCPAPPPPPPYVPPTPTPPYTPPAPQPPQPPQPPYVPPPYVPPPPAPPPPSGTQGFLDLIRRTMPQISPAAILGDRFPGRAGGNKPQDACLVCVTVCHDEVRQELVCDTAISTISCYQDISYGRKNPYAPQNSKCTNSYWGCHLRGTFNGDTNMPNGCVGDPNERKIINGQTAWCPWVPATTWSGLGSNGYPEPLTGPNINCPTPMLGLSGNRTQVIQTIERMTPIPGGTHADVGLRWGLRSMAATGGWPAFFGLTKQPVAWNQPNQQKVMILITDGENSQAIDYPGYWGCVGYQNPGCTTGGATPNKAQLDARMLSWCNAIRTTYGITLYTVAVNFSNPAAIAMLEQCAGSPQNAFSVDAAKLQNVLNIIAATVLRLKITQ